ncbi:MAG TPA: LysR family transcriptional regulator [Pseudolabrys sp.]|jgi:DNA-binding transcriptional LysR family regulator|nr:LysR family transcriptional regulator [Pseudolabrys sp.]
MNLSSLDFNLLKVLDALIAERNVTRAGKRLGRSQPAVSNALQRLRHLTDDDLLVRGPSGFVLTPRAEAMREPLREAIALVESCVAGVPQFDPGKATGAFRLSTPDRLSIAVVPALLARLQKAAPNMSLHIITAERQRALELLDAERTDCALGWFDEKPGHCGAELMMEENLFCVFRRDHPILRRGKAFDIAAVLSFPHVVVSASGQGSAIFDDLLKRHGLSRRALVAVTNFTAVPSLLGGSDMIGVFTKLAADAFQTSFGLAKRPVPLDVGKIATQMVWPLRYERDPRHLWLRQQIRAVYREF